MNAGKQPALAPFVAAALGVKRPRSANPSVSSAASAQAISAQGIPMSDASFLAHWSLSFQPATYDFDECVIARPGGVVSAREQQSEAPAWRPARGPGTGAIVRLAIQSEASGREARYPVLTGKLGQPGAPSGSTSTSSAQESRARRGRHAIRLRWRLRASSAARGRRLPDQAAQCRRPLGCKPAAGHHRLGAALLQRSIVQVGIRRADRTSSASGEGSVRSRATTWMVPLCMPSQNAFETSDVHCLVQAIIDGLAYQRMVGISRSPRGSRRRRSIGEDGGDKSSAPMRCSCGGTFRPERNRGSASATPATQRQRVVNIGEHQAAPERAAAGSSPQ